MMLSSELTARNFSFHSCAVQPPQTPLSVVLSPRAVSEQFRSSLGAVWFLLSGCFIFASVAEFDIFSCSFIFKWPYKWFFLWFSLIGFRLLVFSLGEESANMCY